MKVKYFLVAGLVIAVLILAAVVVMFIVNGSKKSSPTTLNDLTSTETTMITSDMALTRFNRSANLRQRNIPFS